MNKEVHYEGWLIKSPPTKRIWRARWRRRWFTLKQGEIPEQFCLEYYTDRNCRKLKGVIDLDQCEQVDCGLRLENRKQKFQFMFDIKTPKRTYYLAADTETDMRDWVNCICQVCHLHDTKQSNELQDENRGQNTALSTAFTNSTNNTTTTSLNSSSGPSSGVSTSGSGGGSAAPGIIGGAGGVITRQSFSNDILRRTSTTTTTPVVDQQPRRSSISASNSAAAATYQNNSDCAYVNTEYTNRETLLCDVLLDRQQLATATAAAAATGATAAGGAQQTSASPNTGIGAVYLNTSIFQAQNQAENSRLVVNANGVVRKIPENLVLNNTPLPESQPHSVQPSPALSTASGPYIPISECFSGSPKFIIDGNNPTTPLNNLDPKFYDNPRSHNNIGLNLTNDQSYSPKITNCSLQQIAAGKNRSHRSDSDSESVFTDDDEWTHPLPLRENVDRSTRPSDSSVENESFVLTYSQRFSKLPDDTGKEQHVCGSPTSTITTANTTATKARSATETTPTPTSNTAAAAATTTIKTTTRAAALEGIGSPTGVEKADPLEKLAKVLKNKNNLILDFKENEKVPRDVPQLSDTENTSPAIGPLDSTSVVEESYDFPRSHNLPYYNMGQLFEKVISPEANPIAASTPNLMAGIESALSSPATVRTLPRPHYYTNAAPSKVEGNVFRYDFMEQSNLPPVNRKLKPKVNLEDRPPEEVPAKPPTSAAAQVNSPKTFDNITNKLMTTTIQSVSPGANVGAGVPVAGGVGTPPGENAVLKPPSVDRKLKPNAYKIGSAAATMAPATRRSKGAPLSMVLPNDGESYIMETRTLPRQPRPNYANGGSPLVGVTVQHQRTASAAAAMQMSQITMFQKLLQQHQQHQQQQQQQHQQQQQQQHHHHQQQQQHQPKNEHKLQYFDLDVANPPAINRQSMSVGNLNASGSHRMGLSADPSARAPVRTGVVYNSVDFVKTEAFKRIREERKKESEGVGGSSSNVNGNNANSNNTNSNNNSINTNTSNSSK